MVPTALGDMPQRSETRLEPRNFSEIVDLIVDELGNPDVHAQVFRAINTFFAAGTDGLHVLARPISLIWQKKSVA